MRTMYHRRGSALYTRQPGKSEGQTDRTASLVSLDAGCGAGQPAPLGGNGATGRAATLKSTGTGSADQPGAALSAMSN